MQPPDIHYHQTCPQERTIQSATLCDSDRPSSAVGTYASYLKSVYTQEKLPIYDKWPQVKSKKYVNLALIEKEDITKLEADRFTRSMIRGNIDDIKKSKRAMNIDQIAKLPDESWPKCILVEGAPGVGKSTFAWKLCHKWGKGKLLQQYQLVVLLRLRDKRVRAAKNISDLFRYHDNQIQQASFEEIQRTGGKGVLLLFEGYDELPEDLRTENSIFLNVITGWELPEATILVTSRPWASEFLHMECKSRISQHVEILGFTNADIQSYLESTTANDPSLLEGLIRYISCYPHIRSLMYIPLYSAFVVEVYQNCRKYKTEDETQVVPKTMTDLYFSLVRDLLRRHLLDHPVHGKIRRRRVHSFHELPQDIYQQLCELGRIAYEGIRDGQQVIFSDLPEDFETLGLMQCVPELHAGEEAAVSYNFLHLTVQEYLAAFHLSQQPVEKQIEQFQVYCQNKQVNIHFRMVVLFLSGIGKFKQYPSEVLNTLFVEKVDVGSDDEFDAESGSDLVVESDVESSIDSEACSNCNSVTFDTLHWLFESQDNDVIRLLRSSDIQLHMAEMSYGQYVATLFDCFVLGYCVSHSNCTWKIELNYIGDDHVEMLVRSMLEEETHNTGGISEIDLDKGSITSEGLKKHLLSIPKQLIKKLKTLSLCGNNLNSESCVILAKFIPNVPGLKALSLSSNPILQGEAVSLITSLKAHDTLEQLLLDETGIGMEDCRALSELLSSSTSLKELDIGGNAFSPRAIELIIRGLRGNTTLESLDISDSYFSLQNTKSLALMVKTNHSLVDLTLIKCSIDSDGACQLASALHINTTLQLLDMEENRIGVKGATALAEMLMINHTLVDLTLSKCNIDSDGACQLANALCTNSAVKNFDLCDNQIGGDGATALSEMVFKNETLKVLKLCDDSIGEKGAQKLINSLSHNTAMKELWLSEKYKLSIASREENSRLFFD